MVRSISSTLKAVPPLVFTGIQKLGQLKDNPKAFVDVSTIIGLGLATALDINPDRAPRLLKLLKACEAANFLYFFDGLPTPKNFLFQFSADRINCVDLRAQITNLCENDLHKAENLFRHAQLKIESMDKTGDAFRNSDEFLAYLSRPLRDGKGDIITVVPPIDQSCIAEFTNLKATLKAQSFIEKVTNRSWLCVTVASTASFLQSFELLDVAILAAEIGKLAPVLMIVLTPGLEAWLNIFTMNAYLFQAIDGYQKMRDQSLTDEERKAARWLMLCSASEVAVSFGTVVAITCLGPLSYATYPLLILTRRVTLAAAKSFDLCKLTIQPSPAFFKPAIAATALAIASEKKDASEGGDASKNEKREDPAPTSN